MCIFLFWSTDVIFSNLMKNREKLKFKKKLKIQKILDAQVFFFPKNAYNFFLQMISLHKLHFHVHYEKVY